MSFSFIDHAQTQMRNQVSSFLKINNLAFTMFSALIHSEMLIEVLLDMENNDLVVFVKKI